VADPQRVERDVRLGGADRFFADLPDLGRRPGRPAQHLARVVSAARTLEHHPDFLRLLIVFAAQPPAAVDKEIQLSCAAYERTRSSCFRRADRGPAGPASQGRLTTASSANWVRVPSPAGVC